MVANEPPTADAPWPLATVLFPSAVEKVFVALLSAPKATLPVVDALLCEPTAVETSPKAAAVSPNAALNAPCASAE